VPKVVAKPPAGWKSPCDALAKECDLREELDWFFVKLDRFLSELEIVEAKPRESKRRF
jgi:hypothetical protein